jgi:hypothetical protein
VTAAEDADTKLTFNPQARFDQGGEAKVGDYSSKGPTTLGIMQPEVVAPGTWIVSARSSPGGFPAGGNDRLQLAVTSGTSMATPNVAGSVALIEQYFLDGFHKAVSLVPSSSLLRAVVITTANPLKTGDKTINVESGFGQVSLGKHLPFASDPFWFQAGDVIPIANPGHLVANFTVTDTSQEVRVTIAYLDAVAHKDPVFPLVCDLDLIVVSPTKTIFRGNWRTDDTEERFSTVERVIIDAGELELGTYEVGSQFRVAISRVSLQRPARLVVVREPAIRRLSRVPVLRELLARLAKRRLSQSSIRSTISFMSGLASEMADVRK